MLLKEVFTQGVRFLSSSGNEAPAFEAGVMLCHVLKCKKTFLYAHDDYILSDEEYKEYIEIVSKRSKGTPLQYITGHQEFMSLDFKVTPDVLIPRQDTEILVESVLEYAKFTKGKKIDVLDIGTGSGCISVCLAHYIKNSRVVALDISQKSLDVAKYNAEKNGVINKMDFVCGNIFKGLKNIFDSESNLFNIIVSNPPYIASGELDFLEKQVRDFEPLKALDGGEDGLDYYKFIIEEGRKFLKPQGVLAFEVGINQGKEVLNMMKKNYSNVRVIKDLSGIERIVVGVFNC
ncbi:peptide chain release factor N(5)-glutamine methyltransferase [Herbivorax sp. ANBcel31]|uniref:peptide chain release factor N(5)-glutamine methyltransferase n=1 Tax=Herbivorax sp. ANBcel31 TaxID=3069754 RepID=UPI0027B2F57B|nr:peptide chain release factor N(5)-glutamine methyltransferase [Herbivorax sp. ANBcel31]MDQ2086558.1 peptide chain release factor N(5)-glutamine methyltransferase [Herbivorax sp. ANBcel31]